MTKKKRDLLLGRAFLDIAGLHQINKDKQA